MHFSAVLALANPGSANPSDSTNSGLTTTTFGSPRQLSATASRLRRFLDVTGIEVRPMRARGIAKFLILLFGTFIFPGDLLLMGFGRGALGNTRFLDWHVPLFLLLVAVAGLSIGVVVGFWSNRLAGQLEADERVPKGLRNLLASHHDMAVLSVNGLLFGGIYAFSVGAVRNISPELFAMTSSIGFVLGWLRSRDPSAGGPLQRKPRFWITLKRRVR